jgi:outer membrane protein assembly factor BamA
LDTRGVEEARSSATFANHLIDDLYRGHRRQASGWRTDWTSEIAGGALGGDQQFNRHILNTRGYLPLSPRQSVAGRMLLGFSGGTLPFERVFAVGGIGTVRGYRFKEAVGERMTLFNAEYRFDLAGSADDRSENVFNLLRLILFYDAGRVTRPLEMSSSDWLQGTGFGLQLGVLRVEFGFRVDDIPSSRQILVRFSPTF